MLDSIGFEIALLALVLVPAWLAGAASPRLHRVVSLFFLVVANVWVVASSIVEDWPLKQTYLIYQIESACLALFTYFQMTKFNPEEYAADYKEKSPLSYTPPSMRRSQRDELKDLLVIACVCLFFPLAVLIVLPLQASPINLPEIMVCATIFTAYHALALLKRRDQEAWRVEVKHLVETSSWRMFPAILFTFSLIFTSWFGEVLGGQPHPMASSILQATFTIIAGVLDIHVNFAIGATPRTAAKSLLI